MNRQEFENAITALPQDFFFFEENFEKWESFKDETKHIVPHLKPDESPITKKDLHVAFKQIMSLTSSFKDGKTIAEAVSICEKQLNRKTQPDDYDVEVLKKVTETNTEKIRASSTKNSETANVCEKHQPTINQLASGPSSKKPVKIKPDKTANDQSSIPPDWVCDECQDAEKSDKMSKTKKAIEFLCNKSGGGGWVLTFEPKQT